MFLGGHNLCVLLFYAQKNAETCIKHIICEIFCKKRFYFLILHRFIIDFYRNIIVLLQ